MADADQNQKDPPDLCGGFSVSMGQNFDAAMSGVPRLAVGVSGGADSMALCMLLSNHCADKNLEIHAITVDHGLREEATVEAQRVAKNLAGLSNVTHHILKWDHDQKPDARIQEKARSARYDLMHDFMQRHDISHLFLGHHMDDQAETLLFRLAKGSGLDGLACMPPMQIMDNGLILCRPLLGMPKDDILKYCAAHNVPYINDPSNDSDAFARVRLRQSMGVLSREGLTPQRLCKLSHRMARAREALEFYEEDLYDQAKIVNDADRIEFNCKILLNHPEEVFVRVINRAMTNLNSRSGYGVRYDRLENLCADLRSTPMEEFKRRTLGGVIFEYSPTNQSLILTREHCE